MDLVHPVYVSPLKTYPLLIGKDLLNRFEPLIDFKHLKMWTQVREPLPCQALDSNESQCQVTDTIPKSLIDDAVAKPGSGPSTNSKDKDPLLYLLQEPESNTGLLRIMTAIDVQSTSVSDTALALWAENSAISLKLFKTLKQRHQCLPHVAKHSRFPLSPWSTTMATSKIICALDIRWNNRQLTHYFLVVSDLPHDIYIGADILVRLNACIDTVNDIIWAPLSHQLTTSVNLKNLQSGQTMPDACAMITEQEATIPAYSKSVSVCLNMRPGQTLNSKLGFFQPSRTCLKLGLTLEATPLMEVSSRAVYVLFNNCEAQDIHVPKANHLGWLISQAFHDFELMVPVIGPIPTQLMSDEYDDTVTFTKPHEVIAITSILPVSREGICRSELTDDTLSMLSQHSLRQNHLHRWPSGPKAPQMTSLQKNPTPGSTHKFNRSWVRRMPSTMKRIAKDSKRFCTNTRTLSQRIPWIVDWQTSTLCASRQTQMRHPHLCDSTRFQ